MAFDPEVKTKLLLWCDRRCCLCRKKCDVFIELHHIIPQADGGTNDEDNAIPLCFECHARVGHYNDDQPKGNKIKASELKARREQVYEESTRHLVPGLRYFITQNMGEGRGARALPDVGFSIIHLGDAPGVRVLVRIEVYVDGVLKKSSGFDDMYGGAIRWNLNPKEAVHGHFLVAPEALTAKDLRAGIYLTIFDSYERAHALLPVTYVYGHDYRDWWLDPLEVTDSVRRATRSSPVA